MIKNGDDLEISTHQHTEGKSGSVSGRLEIRGNTYWRESFNYDNAFVYWYRVPGVSPYNVRENGDRIEDQELINLLEVLYRKYHG